MCFSFVRISGFFFSFFFVPVFTVPSLLLPPTSSRARLIHHIFSRIAICYHQLSSILFAAIKPRIRSLCAVVCCVSVPAHRIYLIRSVFPGHYLLPNKGVGFVFMSFFGAWLAFLPLCSSWTAYMWRSPVRPVRPVDVALTVRSMEMYYYCVYELCKTIAIHIGPYKSK